jgi:hypothetical protein
MYGPVFAGLLVPLPTISFKYKVQLFAVVPLPQYGVPAVIMFDQTFNSAPLPLPLLSEIVLPVSVSKLQYAASVLLSGNWPLPPLMPHWRNCSASAALSALP